MADDLIPELTLNPDFPLSAPAAQEAAKAQESPIPEAPKAPLPPEDAQAQEAPLPESDLDESKLSETERKAVEEFAKTIDITDSNVILQYGAAAQKNVSAFSEHTLQQVRTKDWRQIQVQLF